VCLNQLTKWIKRVWAHPEPCFDIIRDQRVKQYFANNGVLIHFDAGSLMGSNGGRIKNTAETIVKKGLHTCWQTKYFGAAKACNFCTKPITASSNWQESR